MTLRRRDLTESNSDVVTMYSSLSGRMRAISFCASSMRSGVGGCVEKSERDGEVHALVDAVAGPAVRDNDHRGHGAELYEFTLGGLLGAVTRSDVGNLVGHDAGEFGLLLSAED